MIKNNEKVRFQDGTIAGTTHPEDTNGIPGTVRRAIWLYHAEHAMELPADKKHDKDTMVVPEVFKIGAPPFLEGKVNHDGKGDGHDPTGEARPGGKVGVEESDKLGTACLCTGVCEGELCKVDHVRDNVDEGANNDRPGGSLMEGDILVKGDDLLRGVRRRREIKLQQMGRRMKMTPMWRTRAVAVPARRVILAEARQSIRDSYLTTQLGNKLAKTR
jgi:hypothetical protein